MSTFFFKLSSSLIVALLLTSGSLIAQDDLPACEKIELVKLRLKQLHHTPMELGPLEYTDIIHLFALEIDPSNLLWTTDDVLVLKNTAAKKGLCAAYEKAIDSYAFALKRYDSLSEQIMAEKTKFKSGDVLLTNRSEQSHLRANDSNYKTFLAQVIQLNLLQKAYLELAVDSLSKQTYTSELDQELRAVYVEEKMRFLKRKRAELESGNQGLLNSFLNAIALRYDPHSNYFSTNDKDDLEDELSADVFKFGIQYRLNKNEEIEISGVIPGSSAWHSNKIKVGDVIVAFAYPKQQRIELQNKGIEFLSEIIGKKEFKEATFFMRSSAGENKEVKLIKSKIENSDNSFTGYLLANDTTKIGYIALPSFYTDFESDYQLGCANDVAKEIILLKKDGIQGLVIDLRNNGGGSLKEAIDLAGLFIDEGPIAIYEERENRPMLLKDRNRGTVYDGPLIVLVNNQSASASEVFAGCMQDYQRALIVGSTTYGKGTAQAVFPLDSNQRQLNLGYLKITNGKFYHVSQRSNQQSGIVPEITIPDPFDHLTYFRENKQAFCLAQDVSQKKVTYQKLPLAYSDEILKNSQERIGLSEAHQISKEHAIAVKNKIESDQKTPLEFEDFMLYMKANEKFWDKIYAVNQGTKPCSISNHSFGKQVFGLNDLDKQYHQELILNLQEDLVIQESFLIFNDIFKKQH